MYPFAYFPNMAQFSHYARFPVPFRPQNEWIPCPPPPEPQIQSATLSPEKATPLLDGLEDFEPANSAKDSHLDFLPPSLYAELEEAFNKLAVTFLFLHSVETKISPR